MNKIFRLLSVTLLLAFCAMSAAEAVTINYTAEEIGVNRWQYDYTIFNDSQYDIAAFDIELGYNVSGMELISVAGGWNALADDPYDIGFQVPGMLITWVIDNSFWLSPNGKLGVFSIAFDWFENEAPGSEFMTFIAYGYDWSKLDMSSDFIEVKTVPEPGTLALLGTGLVGFIAYSRSRKLAKQ